MKKKELLIGAFLLLFCATIGAQREEVDSLKASLVRAREDTAKVNILLGLSSRVFKTQPDTAITYSEQALRLANRLNFLKGRAYALKNIGLAYYIKGNYPEVLNYWGQSLETFQSINDQLGVSNLLSNIGAVYFNQGDDPKALKYYLESLRASEKLGDKLRIATALTNIGAVYFNNPADHDKAREYYRKALAISEETGDPDAISTSSVNLGEMFIENEELDSALFFFQKALSANEGVEGNAPYVLNNIGKIYAIRGKFHEAIKFQNQAYEKALQRDARLAIIQSLNGLGDSYLQLSKLEEGPANRSTALSYFTQAFEKANPADLKPEIKKAARGLYELYKIKSDFPLALKYHEIYEAVKDTLLNEEKIKSLALQGAEYEFDKEKQQLQYELDTEIRRQRIIKYASAAGLLVALVFFLILVQFFRLRRIRAAEKFEAQRQLLRQEKLASLGQITAGIAHEIKNPLNFVTNFAEGSLEIGEELEEVIAENEQKLPPEEYELIKELVNDLNQNARDIQKNGLRADRVVKHMMEQVRGNKGEPQLTDINSLVDENINLAYHGYRGNAPGFNLSIEKQYASPLPMVELIPQDIGRVILNIFNNACYALDEKQQLEESFQPKVRIRTEAVKGEVAIHLWDNGPGIPEKIRKNIFQPFFTTKPTGKGNSGLGLSISHDVVTIGHNGTLEVHSEIGRFTEFVIRLPIKRPPSLAVATS